MNDPNLAKLHRESGDAWNQLRALVMIHEPRLVAFVDHVKIVDNEHHALAAEMLSVCEQVRKIRDESNSRASLLRDAENAIAERETLLAELKAARNQIDPARAQLAIIAARDDERAKLAAEIQSLRSNNATLRSENDALKATKRKLREALERAKETR